MSLPFSYSLAAHSYFYEVPLQPIHSKKLSSGGWVLSTEGLHFVHLHSLALHSPPLEGTILLSSSLLAETKIALYRAFRALWSSRSQHPFSDPSARDFRISLHQDIKSCLSALRVYRSSSHLYARPFKNESLSPKDWPLF